VIPVDMIASIRAKARFAERRERRIAKDLAQLQCQRFGIALLCRNSGTTFSPTTKFARPDDLTSIAT